MIWRADFPTRLVARYHGPFIPFSLMQTTAATGKGWDVMNARSIVLARPLVGKRIFAIRGPLGSVWLALAELAL